MHSTEYAIVCHDNVYDLNFYCYFITCLLFGRCFDILSTRAAGVYLFVFVLLYRTVAAAAAASIFNG